MTLSEEVTEEIDALEAIFDPADVERLEEDRLRLRVAPEADGDGHVYGIVFLEFLFPQEYPASKPPIIKTTAAELSDTVVDKVQKVAEDAAEAEIGSIVIFAVADAVREWLRCNTREDAPPPPEVPEASNCNALAEKAGGDGGDSSDDDLDVDSSDLDGEFIDALRDVLRSDAEKMRELRAIKKMSGKEQRTALRGMLKSLTRAQRDELIGSDSSDDDDDAADAPGRGGQAPKTVVKLPAAAIECSVGHELTAFSARPPDYKNFDGHEYTCDVCSQDGSYKAGVYHCTKCFAKGGKQFDACPSCGQNANSRGGGGSEKKQKNNNRKKR